MALDYQKNTAQFAELHRITDVYIGWFASVCHAVAYPESADGINEIPKAFVEWINGGAVDDFDSVVLDEIKGSYNAMEQHAFPVLEYLKSGEGRPESDVFEQFKVHFDGFLNRLRRSEKDSAIDGSGIDELTGLRSRSVLDQDMKRELDRLSRQGNPFSLLMTKVDNFDESNQESVQLAVSVIKQCMRAFDDAYYLKDGQFLIMLKHADLIGAQAAVKRLQNAMLEKQEQSQNITMSYCMSEPIVEDDVQETLNNMQQDLVSHAGESDSVLQLKEISPLERYVNNLE